MIILNFKVINLYIVYNSKIKKLIQELFKLKLSNRNIWSQLNQVIKLKVIIKVFSNFNSKISKSSKENIDPPKLITLK
jgi:hypothetical protein